MFTFFEEPISLYPALIVTFIALWSIFILTKLRKIQLQEVKYHAFDALKGYLTMIVFISHSCTWYFYLQNNQWAPPPSSLYIQVGYTSISLFFMMTAFLFCNKLMNGKTDWIKLYVTRLVRLYPLYIIAVLTVFFIVGCLSNFTLGENLPLIKLVSQLERWLMFTIRTDPDINGVNDTWRIICRITWTLRYEWIFYLALPIIGILFFKNRSNLLVLALSIFVITYMYLYWDLTWILFAPFLGGIIASLLSKQKILTKLATHWIGSVIVLLLIGVLIIMYNFFSAISIDLIPLALTTIIFIFISHGTTIFGFLSVPTVRQLGQLSYGIYLFHGILLFTLFKFIIGFSTAATLSNTQYWLVIFLLTPILITISFFLHIYVEIPALKYATPISSKVKDILALFKRQMVTRWEEILNWKL